MDRNSLARSRREQRRPLTTRRGSSYIIWIRRESRWSEEHPFTIASSPARNEEICLTIKGCGDFTSHIGLVQKGELATIHGPFGRFSHLFHSEERDSRIHCWRGRNYAAYQHAPPAI